MGQWENKNRRITDKKKRKRKKDKQRLYSAVGKNTKSLETVPLAKNKIINKTKTRNEWNPAFNKNTKFNGGIQSGVDSEGGSIDWTAT